MTIKKLVNMTNRTKKSRKIVEIKKNYSILGKIFQKGIDKTDFMWYTMGNNYGKMRFVLQTRRTDSVGIELARK